MADSTTPAPRVGVFDFLENHLDYRFKIIVPILLVVAAVIGFNYVRDLRRELEEQKTQAATLNQKFEKLGTEAVTGNQVQTQPQVNAQAKDVFGPAVIDAMSRQNATLQQLTTALAQVQSRVSQIEGLNAQAFAQHQNQTTGALTGFPLDEVRRDPTGKALPGLDSVSLSYDPAQKDPNAAFRGTFWTHFREDFTVGTGEWQKKKDGGFSTAVSLKRTVYKPDPADPSKWIALGTEAIPVADGSTVYGPEGLRAGPKVEGRWTAFLGAAKGNVGGYRPAGFIDYRLTTNWGAWGGVAAGTGSGTGIPAQSQAATVLFGISRRFGAPK